MIRHLPLQRHLSAVALGIAFLLASLLSAPLSHPAAAAGSPNPYPGYYFGVTSGAPLTTLTVTVQGRCANGEPPCSFVYTIHPMSAGYDWGTRQIVVPAFSTQPSLSVTFAPPCAWGLCPIRQYTTFTLTPITFGMHVDIASWSVFLGSSHSTEDMTRLSL